MTVKMVHLAHKSRRLSRASILQPSDMCGMKVMACAHASNKSPYAQATKEVDLASLWA